MSNNATPESKVSGNDDSGTALDDRDVRALTEYLTVLDDVGRVRGADELYLVTSESGSEYLVDTRTQSCECPDFEYRDVRCKHLRRVAFATGERAIPEWADRDVVDDQLGAHVDGDRRVVATDGGEIVVAGDDAEILEGDDTDDVNDECDCDELGGDFPCWPCYRAGRAEFPDETTQSGAVGVGDD